MSSLISQHWKSHKTDAELLAERKRELKKAKKFFDQECNCPDCGKDCVSCREGLHYFEEWFD